MTQNEPIIPDRERDEQSYRRWESQQLPELLGNDDVAKYSRYAIQRNYDKPTKNQEERK